MRSFVYDRTRPSNYLPSLFSEMGVDVYYFALSAPCRSVLLLAKSIGLELNLKNTDIMAGATKTPEYIKVIFSVNSLVLSFISPLMC